jgi:S1-C subfamily serine protease
MTNPASELSQALASVVEAAEPSVVRVDGGRRRSGSGTVYGSDGAIVTALHLLDREEDIQVSDGVETVSAALVGADPGLDLAVLRAERALGKAAAFAASGELRRGELVLSVSRPGRGARAALGVVSALAGEWRAARGAKVDQYVELSLPLGRGFSGSLIVDAAGRALGVGSGGLVRATPLVLTQATLERTVGAILKHGRVRRAYLGGSFQPVRLPAALAERSGQRGALILLGLEPGGPSELAGLALGDVVLAAGGTKLSSIDELFAVLEEERIDQPLELQLLRGGSEQTITITPRARP